MVKFIFTESGFWIAIPYIIFYELLAFGEMFLISRFLTTGISDVLRSTLTFVIGVVIGYMVVTNFQVGLAKFQLSSQTIYEKIIVSSIELTAQLRVGVAMKRASLEAVTVESMESAEREDGIAALKNLRDVAVVIPRACKHAVAAAGWSEIKTRMFFISEEKSKRGDGRDDGEASADPLFARNHRRERDQHLAPGGGDNQKKTARWNNPPSVLQPPFTHTGRSFGMRKADHGEGGIRAEDENLESGFSPEEPPVAFGYSGFQKKTGAVAWTPENGAVGYRTLGLGSHVSRQLERMDSGDHIRTMREYCVMKLVLLVKFGIVDKDFAFDRCLLSLDNIVQGVSFVQSTYCAQIPNAYRSFIGLAVHLYVITLPVFTYTPQLWWLVLIVYPLVVYLFLTPHLLGLTLSKSLEFFRYRSYLPINEWCEDAEDIMGRNFEIMLQEIGRIQENDNV